ncbi:MAG: uroporphyrinogen-III synthase, partial [Planctomycetota bacterium]
MDQAKTFKGLHVSSFESRRADDMRHMIEKFDGHACVAASMREVPTHNHSELSELANELLTGQIETVIVLTGVGFKHLMAAVEKIVDRERFIATLRDITTIARGPKPVVAMKEFGITPTYRVHEPNTWRELLQVVDTELSVSNQKVAIQEYGQPNPSLIAGLEARGARVRSVQVYRWDFPEEIGPMDAALKRLAAGEQDVTLFTSAHQVTN